MHLISQAGLWNFYFFLFSLTFGICEYCGDSWSGIHCDVHCLFYIVIITFLWNFRNDIFLLSFYNKVCYFPYIVHCSHRSTLDTFACVDEMSSNVWLFRFFLFCTSFLCVRNETRKLRKSQEFSTWTHALDTTVHLCFAGHAIGKIKINGYTF